MATNSEDSGFDRTQCAVAFLPTMFTISANMSSRETTVSPTTRPEVNDTRLPDIDITANAMRSLNLLSRVSSSSALNDALNRNLWNTVSDVGHTLITERDLLSSVEDALAAVLDDILGAYGAAQVVLAHDTVETDVTAVGMMVAGVLWTGFWAGMSGFDGFDGVEVMVAASAGGTGIAEGVQAGCVERVGGGGVQSCLRSGEQMDGDGAGGLQVQFCRLGENAEGLVVVFPACRDGARSCGGLEGGGTWDSRDDWSEIELVQH
ncbi:hypothetical protein LTR27_010010 [Elasticomyces elasticus]|nr:hypothetical protein LTR27_010010 [Elasticomyces elasticus]